MLYLILILSIGSQKPIGYLTTINLIYICNQETSLESAVKPIN